VTSGPPHPTGQRQALSLGQIAGRPAELVIAAVLLAGSAIWVVIATALRFGDLMDIFDFSTTTGLWMLVVMLVPALLAVLQALAGWLVFDADPLGRALAIIVAITWVLGMIAAETRAVLPLERDAHASYIVAMICALVAAAILLIGPEGTRALRDNAGRRASTSMTAARMSLLMAGAALVVLGVVQLIAALSEDGSEGKTIASAIVMVIAGLAGAAASQILATPAMEIRLGISGVALAAWILIVALGPRPLGTVLAASLLVVAPILLWVTTDARAFFGEGPLTKPSPAGASGVGGTGTRPAGQATQQMPAHRPGATGIGDAPAMQPAAHRPGAAPLDQAGVQCPSCGAMIGPDDAFCGSCGTRAPEPEPEPVADAPAGPRSCTSCGREANDDARFCAGCGSALPELPRTCGGCGAALDPDDRFCAFCGREAA